MERRSNSHCCYLLPDLELQYLTTNFWTVLRIILLLASVVATGVSTQPNGFISVDCGGTGGKDAVTGLDWVTDDGVLDLARHLVEEGVAILATVNLDDKTATPRDNAEQLKTAIVFVPVPVVLDPNPLLPKQVPVSRSKYCYKLNVTYDESNPESTNYLVRAMFPSRNLTASVGGEELNKYGTRFYLTVDSTFVATIDLDPVKPQTIELKVTPLDDMMYVCLVPLEDRSSMPAISSLELRPLPVELYNRSESAASNTGSDTSSQTTYFMTISRLNFGGNESLPAVRYPVDKYDRLWYPAHIPQEKLIDIIPKKAANSAAPLDAKIQPPPEVLLTAWEGSTVSSELSFDFEIGKARSYRRLRRFFSTLLLLDVNPGGSRDIREVIISNRGTNLKTNQTFSGGLNISTIISQDRVVELYEDKMSLPHHLSTFSIKPHRNSTLPAMVNAVELFGTFTALTTRTENTNAATIQKFLKSVTHNLDTTGDACLPVPWSWLVCSIEVPPRITQVNIGNNNLTGTLPPFKEKSLVNLETLSLRNNKFNGSLLLLVEALDGPVSSMDLSYNHFSGSIPVDIERLTGLKSVDLSFNNLSGTLPRQLVKLPELTYLSLQNNDLTGVVPDEIWSNTSKLETVLLDGNNFTELNLTSWCKNVLATKSLAKSQLKVSLIGNKIENVILPSQDVIDRLPRPLPPSSRDIVSTSQQTSSTPDHAGIILLGDNPWCQSFAKTSATLSQRYLCRQKEYEDFWEPRTAHTSGASRRTEIIVGVVSGLLVVSMACLLLILLWRTWKRMRDLRQIQEALAKDDVRPPFYKYEELKAATRDFSEENELGRGAFGAVYKAVLADQSIVAVKRLYSTEQNIAEFLKEMVLITGIKHRHLVQLKGCCVRDRKRLLVYEYAENKNLAEALWGDGRSPLTWPQRFKICVGIARGLCYLHEELQPKIIHRDIKPQNILLDKYWNAKIADFGLARPAGDATQFATHVGGTLGYFSPEYATVGIFTEKLDVYSYGVLVLEIVSGRRCIGPSLPVEEIYLKSWAHKLYEEERLLDVAETGLLETGSPEEILTVLKTALSCLHDQYDKRPSMSQVVNVLTGNVSDLAINIISELKDHERVADLDASTIAKFKESSVAEGRPLLHSTPSSDPQGAVDIDITIPR